jgi:exodeoxyribonuclease VII small subunit
MAADQVSSTPAPDKDESFEALLARLEEIVSQLEAGERPLDESLALYEGGVAALKRCHVTLDRAEKRIRLLLQDSNGNPQLREAELPNRAERAEKGSSRKSRPVAVPEMDVGSEVDGAPTEDSRAETPVPQAAREVQKKVDNSTDQNVDSDPESQHNPPTSVKSKPKSSQAGNKAGGSLFGSSQ